MRATIMVGTSPHLVSALHPISISLGSASSRSSLLQGPCLPMSSARLHRRVGMEARFADSGTLRVSMPPTMEKNSCLKWEDAWRR